MDKNKISNLKSTFDSICNNISEEKVNIEF